LKLRLNNTARFLGMALERSNRLPHLCQSILEECPRMKVILIAPVRKSTTFYKASLLVASNQMEASGTGAMNALRGIQPMVRW
jgi:hypothetical protein